jgi:lipopolysaccharide transport system ATP-binding protein
MNDLAIRVDNLSKMYRIGVAEKLPQNPWQKTKRMVASPFAYLRKMLQPPKEEEILWALRNVSFEVRRGEVIGIIGPNGAGKSTLLKILSRITEPTEGQAVINGRVGSLLEVGTGFHPELTGRENIYLNGAILGMKKAEIEKSFEEIVSFAEIEKFLETPVKRYSSGMRVRLAFAVAAHLEPEILLIDEVLAVGDAAFQKKCLGKMENVAKEGKTILFVSHNMAAVKVLCQKGIHLDKGVIRYWGKVTNAINDYLTLGEKKSVTCVKLGEEPLLPVQLLSVEVVDGDDELLAQHPHDQPFWLKIQVLVRSRIANIYLAAHIHDYDLETIIFTRDFESDENQLLHRESGIHTYSIKIPAPLLVPGNYRISVHVARSSPPEIISGIDYACPFEIIDNGSALAKAGFPWRGKINVPLKWERVNATETIKDGSLD